MNIKKKRIIIFILIVMVFSSTYFIASSFSKYRSNVISDGNVGIAKWELLVNDTSGSIDLYIGEDAVTYTLRITNNSEVASRYSAYFSNIPENILIAIDDSGYKSGVNGEIIIENIGETSLTDQSNIYTHTVYFKAIEGASEYSGKSIDMDVKFVQKELN